MLSLYFIYIKLYKFKNKTLHIQIPAYLKCMNKEILEDANKINAEIEHIKEVLQLLEYKTYGSRKITLLETFSNQKIYIEYENENKIDSIDVPILINKELIVYITDNLLKRLVELEKLFEDL